MSNINRERRARTDGVGEKRPPRGGGSGIARPLAGLEFAYGNASPTLIFTEDVTKAISI